MLAKAKKQEHLGRSVFFIFFLHYIYIYQGFIQVKFDSGRKSFGFGILVITYIHPCIQVLL